MSDVIDLTAEVFPGIAIELIMARYGMLTLSTGDVITVLGRPARAADPNWSICVYATEWTPVTNSYEMTGKSGSREATLQRYTILIQAFIKDANEERGILSHSVLSEVVRSILESDGPLRAQLGGLAATLGDSVKMLKRWWVASGKYQSGSVGTNNLYLTTNQLILEVEKTT